MRIAIDYTAAVRQQAGIGRYTRNLVEAVGALDAQNQYILFVAAAKASAVRPKLLPPNWRVRSIPVPDRWLHIFWQRLRIPVPVQTVTGPLELFHSPDFVLPPLGRTPALVTVHDLSFLRVPQCFVPGFRGYLEAAVRRAVRRAKHILADSESTRRDLGELLAVSPERVTVVYPGVEARFRRVEDSEVLAQVSERYQLPGRFILGLGTLQPRKNFVTLVEAFGRLLAERGGEPEFAGLHLVIVGAAGWMVKETLDAVRKSGLARRIHLTSFVDDQDLPPLYSLAAAFAFPSWYEGFGLPVLEAMACEAPVVAADNSSLPEVVGQAGLTVDAADVDGLATALGRLLTDNPLRTRLASLGREQARRFSWESAGKQVYDLYRRFGRKAGGVQTS